MNIRKATAADTAGAWEIIAEAKKVMLDRGRRQWTADYPTEETIAADIRSGEAYVACGPTGIEAYARISLGAEPAYADIEGRWLGGMEYVVVHRLAVASCRRGSGLGREMLLFSERVCLDEGRRSIKADTNYDNAEMLGLLLSLGYTRCGTVDYGSGHGRRIAFEKTITPADDGSRPAQTTGTPMETKTEFEKMRSREQYRFDGGEILQSLKRAKELCRRLQTMTISDGDYRQVIEELIPGIPESSTVCPPFHCDHGHGITMGRNVFVNYNCVMLDGGRIRIGNDVKIGPSCQLYTPQHPTDYVERREPKETAHPISIGDDTWLGGNVTVCPGVTIGRRCIIAAGSVVAHDIPDDSMAAGNPAVVKKRLNRTGRAM